MELLEDADTVDNVVSKEEIIDGSEHHNCLTFDEVYDYLVNKIYIKSM